VNPSPGGAGSASKAKGGGKGWKGEMDLDLSSNRIAVLPRELFQLENLVYLSLSEWSFVLFEVGWAASKLTPSVRFEQGTTTLLDYQLRSHFLRA